ncbi:MAG: 16S rRNA (uracil(1498)-N(3))-methyltransferase [Chthoniobacterales bacterium]
MHRFYIAPENFDNAALALVGAEAHHCANVLRMQAGERAVVFNGRGREVTAEIERIGGSEVHLRKLSERITAPLRYRITLGQAMPKGKNMDLIVQKAVELGAAEIAPLISEHTVVRLDRRDAVQKQTKWQTIAVEAAKQCGQNWLPHVAEPRTLAEFFSDSTRHDLQLVGALQEDAVSFKNALADFERQHVAGNAPRSVLILIGPEGDFTVDELTLARRHGCRPISLGPIVLRVETAAIYCLSVLSYELLS